jgi:hypothetical protein
MRLEYATRAAVACSALTRLESMRTYETRAATSLFSLYYYSITDVSAYSRRARARTGA